MIEIKKKTKKTDWLLFKHLSDTFAYRMRSAYNNLFVTLRVIHKLKIIIVYIK